MIAARLVSELMPVSVLVAGEGASTLAAELSAEGAAAEMLAGGQAPEEFDLAILLAPPGSAADPGTRQLVDILSHASERLLFAPLPLGAANAAGTPALPQLGEWFEVFAEFGYQPVVEFDASFVSPGAFLVDRAAIAAESELAAFADRLTVAPAPAPAAASTQGAAQEAEHLRAKLVGAEAALAEAREAVAARQAEIDGLLVEAGSSAVQAEAARRRMQTLEEANTGWDGLRHWARALVGDPSRDTPAALARDLPQLNAWRDAASPIVQPEAPRRRLWAMLRPNPLRPDPLRPGPFAAILSDTALVRASRLFDAAWYVAATAELAEHPLIDPVFHYVLVGGPNGADPGPWFDTASYVADYPDLAGNGQCPLVHAIRTGNDRKFNLG